MILTDNLKLAKHVGTNSSIPAEVAQAIIQKVKRDRVNKNIDVVKHWDLYQGNHADHFRQRNKEDNVLFEYRKDHAVVANEVRYIVDLSAKYLYGRATKVSRRYGENQVTDARMRRLTKLSNYEALMLGSSKTAGVCGEVGMRLVPIDEQTMDQPDGLATPTTYPHPIPLDPIKTFFLLSPWDKITAVVLQNEYRDYATGQIHKTLELITADSRWFWDDLGGTGITNPIPKFSSANTYPINTEFVLFKNNDFWIDDVQDIINLNIQMDEVLTDNAHFFAKHGWPQLVSSVDLSGVQHASSHIWNVESEGPQDKIADKMFFLQWDGRMTEAHEFIKYLEALIFKISCTARIATGDLEAIGQLRSGPAIVAAHSPSIQKTQEKQVIWGHNEINLLQAMAAFDSLIHAQAVEVRYAGFDPTIIFPVDFAPGEELVRAEVRQIEINSHLSTLRDLIKEKHPEFNAEQTDKYRDELFDDAETLVDSLREFVTTTPGATGGAATKKPKGQSGSAASKSQQQK